MGTPNLVAAFAPRRRGRLVVVVLAAATLAVGAGCPRPPAKATGGTTVTVDGDPPDYPDGFDPGQALPEPAPPDPGAYGVAYLQMIYPAIRDAWSAFLEDCRLRLPPDHPLNSPTLEATVEIVIDGDGQVASVTLIRPSGNDDFDGVARDVAAEAAPFPPPPKALISDDDHAYVTWLFARDRRQAGVATAALRRVEWPLDRAVPKLVEAGRLDDAARRLAAAAPGATGAEKDQILGLAERVFVTAVRGGLAVDDASVQRAAIEAIRGAARHAGGGALAPLAPTMRELRSIADGAVEMPLRAAAIAALGAIGDRDAAPMLLAILDKDQGHNVELSGEAARALVALDQAKATAAVLRPWLTSTERAKVTGALVTLGRAGVPGLEAELAKLIGHKDVAVRTGACAALGTALTAGASDAAWKAIRKGLDDRDASVRGACARGAAVAAAGGGKSRAAYWRLVELFRDKDERVRAGAALAAVRLDPSKVTQELGALAKEKSPVVLAALAEGLGATPAGPPDKRLVALSGADDVRVRTAAVRALAGRADAESRGLAAGKIVDPEVAVRLAAIEAIDDPAQLETLASDPVAELAAAASRRRIALAGRWGSLPEVAEAVAAAPKASLARVQLAGAWLQAP
ncbi:MAG: TonB family protein [Kofleriaceae bacterium]|nr:TonB family protein [Kofleriaceae bacterium]